MDAATITTWMTEIESSVRAERDHLVQLDAAIGDGDHGTNMARGFEAVVQALANDSGSPPGRVLIVAGRTLVSTVGGASGPLWGSALRSGGRALGDQTTFEAGMRSTIPLQARKGRASYLGERSVGHQDPGATSTALIIRALQRAVATEA